MRNIAFSILLAALAVMQIAVVSAELSHSSAPVAAARGDQPDARLVLASSETGPEAAAF